MPVARGEDVFLRIIRGNSPLDPERSLFTHRVGYRGVGDGIQNEVRFRAYLWRRYDVKRGCQWPPMEQVALLMVCVAVCGHDGGGSVAKVAAELTREGTRGGSQKLGCRNAAVKHSNGDGSNGASPRPDANLCTARIAGMRYFTTLSNDPGLRPITRSMILKSRHL